MSRKTEAMEHLFADLAEVLPNACQEDVQEELWAIEELETEQIINISNFIAKQVLQLPPDDDSNPLQGVPFTIHFIDYQTPKDMNELEGQLRILPTIAKRLATAFEENDLIWVKRSINNIEKIIKNTKFFIACQLWDAIDPEECINDMVKDKNVSNENRT